jgi:hypothetical protein
LQKEAVSVVVDIRAGDKPAQRVTLGLFAAARRRAHSSMWASIVVIDGLKLPNASLHMPIKCSTWSAEPVDDLADCFVLMRDAPCDPA